MAYRTSTKPESTPERKGCSARFSKDVVEVTWQKRRWWAPWSRKTIVAVHKRGEDFRATERRRAETWTCTTTGKRLSVADCERCSHVHNTVQNLNIINENELI